ncbi:hypothetical protein LEMLEM_LOCUS18750 [Lemmus lemmus]
MYFRFQAQRPLLTPVLLLQHALFLDANDIVVAGMAWKESTRKMSAMASYVMRTPSSAPSSTDCPLGKFRAQENERGNLARSFCCEPYHWSHH